MQYMWNTSSLLKLRKIFFSKFITYGKIRKSISTHWRAVTSFLFVIVVVRSKNKQIWGKLKKVEWAKPPPPIRVVANSDGKKKSKGVHPRALKYTIYTIKTEKNKTLSTSPPRKCIGKTYRLGPRYWSCRLSTAWLERSMLDTRKRLDERASLSFLTNKHAATHNSGGSGKGLLVDWSRPTTIRRVRRVFPHSRRN